MVNNNDSAIDREIRMLADALTSRVEWAKTSYVKALPQVIIREEIMAKKIAPSIEVTSIIEELISKKMAKPEKLRFLKENIIGDCTRCKLCEGRTQVVFGSGDPDAQLVFVGEGPGAEEDKQGVPFVGRAGQLLTKMIEAMGLSRDRVHIINVVKCRPPGNRDPEPDEVASCSPFLKAQLEIIKPKVIVTLGRYASQTLLATTTPMSQLRGTWTSYQGIDVMPTFHPAFLLRNPPKKKEVWMDLQEVMTRL